MNAILPLTLSVLLGAAFGSKKLLPETLRYIEYPHALPGKILKLQKAYDEETGRISFESNLPGVTNANDLVQLEAIEEAARRLAHGNLNPRLAERLPSLGLLEKVRVAVRIKTEPHAFLDKTRHTQEELIANSQAYIALPPVASPLVVLARHGLLAASMPGDNIVIVEAGKIDLEGLKLDADIASIWEYTEPSPLSVELTTLASSGYQPDALPSGAGSGVKAATYEYGLTSTFLSCIGVTPASYDTWNWGANDPLKRHSQVMFRILAASAPSATFYHRNSTSYNLPNDVSYIVNNGIQTVSMSVDRGGISVSGYRATYSEFLTMDDMAFTYPYPVYVTPSGNGGYSYEVNWQCYNCLSVGNVRHTNGSTFEMADLTQTRNPPPRYGGCIVGSGSNCAGDREMPHVVAPGIPSSGSDFATTCLEGTGTVSGGTSLSAPVANGMVADVIASDSRMVGWPEKVRATMILQAQNVESDNRIIAEDERDGAGVVTGTEAVSFAQSHTSVAPGNTACASGMAASSYYASDFSANKRFNVLVPNPKPTGKHLRVVLTWDSNPLVDSSSTNALSDLDLVVQKNGSTGSSNSLDDNVEVVDIALADLTAGSSYYIDIVPVTNRIPATGHNYFYYALAWGWALDHAP